MYREKSTAYILFWLGVNIVAGVQLSQVCIFDTVNVHSKWDAVFTSKGETALPEQTASSIRKLEVRCLHTVVQTVKYIRPWFS